MKKIYYNKLIRDKIPDKIRSKGADCRTEKLSPKKFRKELIKKVFEEADGLAAAKGKKELISELADVLDVVEEIRKLEKISKQDIKKGREENNKNKGGFKDKLFLFWSSDIKYSSNERKYKKPRESYDKKAARAPKKHY